MSIKNIWKEDFRVLSFHMDPNSKAHLTSICNFLQEGAGAHAESAGFGFDDMMRRNQVWVLSRLKVKIASYPKWKDQLKLKTWSLGKEGIFYVRDFEIEDCDNQSIIKATSSWAAINTKTRRPERVVGLEEGLHSLKNKRAIDENLTKLPEMQHPVFLRKRKIEYTDIDLVYHVNNVKHIEIIINSFPKDMLLNQNIECLEINYLSEAKYGEDVLIYSEQLEDNVTLVKVVKESDDNEVCRAQLKWAAN